ncbi:uncharacterized protein [Procambarus clarkii]|uniref:uncharacterized protein n=1 Tax=Procambarus clarkii TaxID=6728 RepID=UPI003742DFBA
MAKFGLRQPVLWKASNEELRGRQCPTHAPKLLVHTIFVKLRNPTPCETKDPYPCETKDPYPCETKDPYPCEAKDPYPCEAKDPYPCEAKDPYPCEAKDPYPCEAKDPYPCEAKDPYPCEAKDPYPCEAKDPYPCEAKDSYPCEAKDPYPCEAKDPYPCEAKDPYPCEAKMAFEPRPCEAKVAFEPRPCEGKCECGHHLCDVGERGVGAGDVGESGVGAGDVGESGVGAGDSSRYLDFNVISFSDRSKKAERRPRGEGEGREPPGTSRHTAGASDASRVRPLLHQSPSEGTYTANTTGDRPPESPAAGKRWCHEAHSRRSFRLPGHAPDLDSDRNMLPFVLVGSNAMFTHCSHDCITRKENPTPDNNPTFETRWDSLRGQNKGRSLNQLKKIPPGWEDVMHDGDIKHTDRDAFCPAFVIKESTKVMNSHTPVIIDSPISDRPRWPNRRIIHQPEAANAFDFTELNEKVENITPESYIRKLSLTTSDVAPVSSSSSPSMTPPATSSCNFSSNTFSVCDRNMKDAANSDMQETPGPCLEAHLCETLQDTSHVYFHSENPTENRNIQLCNNFVYRGSHSEVNPGASIIIKDPLSSRQYSEASDDGEDNKNTTEDTFHASPYSSTSVPGTTTDGGTQPPADLLVNDSTRREHWITFDGSMENLDLNSDETFDIISAGTHDVYEANQSNCQTPETPPVSAPPSEDHEKSILDVEQRREVYTTGNYKAMLVRTYSQRGRRASKRVISSVSRRISTVDYGKLVDPVSPIYSKAVLTMQSGPGLFEKVKANDDTDTIKSERLQQSLQGGKEQTKAVELPLKNTTISSDEVASTSFVEPAGKESMCIPRLRSALVRRSVSLNISRVEQEVPFQRLPDRRPGSFRKAISGLGTLARSFTRKSDSGPTGTSETRLAAQDPGLCRSSNFATSSRQTPKAPRLPRRATSHKHDTSTDI